METLMHATVKPWIEMMGWGLLHSVWQGAAVALVLAMLLKRYRKQAAAIRYGLAGMALCCVVALPVATVCLYHAPAAAPLSEELEAPLPPTVQPAFTSTDGLDAESRSAVAFPAKAATSMPKADKTAHVDKGDKAEAASMPWFTSTLQSSFPWLVLGWLLGIFLLSIRHALGWRRLVKFRRATTACAETRLITLFQSIKKRMGITKAAALTVSAQIKSPITIGWLKPVVCLPVFALSGLTTQQWEALLIHELAHVRRWDFVVNILQTWLEILVFYHPAAWWISRQIRLEREACCDDHVIRLTGQPVQYARTLTSLASAACGEPAFSMAASGGGFARRIRRIVSTRPGKGNTLKKTCAPWLCFLTAMLMACCLPLSFLAGDTHETGQTPIVFMSDREASGKHTRKIYRINPDGTGEKSLTNLRGGQFPVLSPDGKKIAFYDAYALSIMDINGNNPKRLLEKIRPWANAFSWSPDSRKIVISDRIVSVDGTLLHQFENLNLRYPAWSPDGKRIAFKSRTNHTNELWIVCNDGTGKARLTGEIYFGGIIGWSPDSRQIVFIKKGQVCVINADGTGEKPLTRDDLGPSAPSWAADDKHIVFEGRAASSQKNRTRDIFCIDLPAAKIRRITTTPFDARFPRVSPKGTQVVFVVFERDKDTEIGVVNLDGTGLKILTNNNFSDRAPDW